jgi:pimeloyl-ACP methyl ester carboxylesterase
MSNSFDVLWLSASPGLKRFDLPLVKFLSRHISIAQWEYFQTKDEASSLDKAVVLLHDFLKHRDRPVHLIGHGISGVLALTYARRYRKRVRSLTLMAVAAQPAMTWQAHYYVQRHMWTSSREVVLANNVRSLFGKNPPYGVKNLMSLLQRDLEESPSLHSLFKIVNLPKGGVSMPLLVCGSKSDPVVSPPALYEWVTYFKSEDTLWECAAGNHFFHFFYPEKVGNEIVNFWQRFEEQVPTQVEIVSQISPS